jgi:hypothetical protein
MKTVAVSVSGAAVLSMPLREPRPRNTLSIVMSKVRDRIR